MKSVISVFLLIVILGGLRKCEVLNIELKYIQVEEQKKLLYFNSRQREKRKKGLYQKEFVRTKLECLA
ncbi:hypothetical protein HpCK93_05870 [Helicobacter pylori]